MLHNGNTNLLFIASNEFCMHNPWINRRCSIDIFIACDDWLPRKYPDIPILSFANKTQPNLKSPTKLFHWLELPLYLRFLSKVIF